MNFLPQNKNTDPIDKFWIGAVLGLISPVVTFFIFMSYNFKTLSVSEFYDVIGRMGQVTTVLSFCLLPSFFIFFVFYWLHKNRAAQGVVGAALIFTLTLVIIAQMHE